MFDRNGNVLVKYTYDSQGARVATVRWTKSRHSKPGEQQVTRPVGSGTPIVNCGIGLVNSSGIMTIRYAYDSWGVKSEVRPVDESDKLDDQ